MSAIIPNKLLKFGQPVGSVYQQCFVATDIYESMAQFSRNLRIGPWFLFEPYKFLEAEYLGKPAKAEIKIALSFSGHINIELIQQVNNAPSMYQDITKRGGGFHHFGVSSVTFEDDVRAQTKLGNREVFRATNLRGARLAYFETDAKFGGMVEIVEFVEAQEEFYNKMFEAARDPSAVGTIVRL